MADKKTADPAKRTGEVKSTPDVRDEASENTFAKDYLVYLDDPKKVADEIHEANKQDIKHVALQRGLRATGEATLKDSEVKDEHNVLLTYTLPVKPNTISK